MPIANEHRVLFISPWMTGEGERLQSPYYLSATPQERALIHEALAHIAASGAKEMALIYSDNAYSIGHQEVVKDELRGNYPSLKIVFESKPAQDAVDYRTDLAKVQASGADALYAVMATGLGASTVVRQSKDLGLALPIYMPFSAISQLKPEERTGGQIDGVLYPVSKDYDRTAEFNAKYKARFGMEPAAITGATAYDMTALVLQAIDNGAKTPEEVAKYLRNVKDYRGYSNMISFGTDGHVQPGPVELREVKGDSFTVVE
jgi:ABC-type branched-subunit amino acid transport system substrate-binding protein